MGAAAQQHTVVPKKTPRTINSAEGADSDVRLMVESLASRNSAPKLNGARDTHPTFDSEFDWEEYNRVWEAIPTLIKHAEASWPTLVKHLDDKRYSITARSHSDYARNWTVGDLCRSIIGRNMSEAYYQNLRPESALVYARFRLPGIARDAKTLKSWCEARSDKSLYELQIEACKWAAIELGEPLNELERPSPLRRRAWVAAIEAQIESLEESQSAIPFRAFGPEEFARYSKLSSKRSRPQ